MLEKCHNNKNNNSDNPLTLRRTEVKELIITFPRFLTYSTEVKNSIVLCLN